MVTRLLIVLWLMLPAGFAQAASNDCIVTSGTPTLQAGTSAPCYLNQSGEMLTSGSFSGSISGADGAIVDGANATIKATVKSYTNSKPLAVVPVDTNGDAASIGGGTEYTEDAAAAANPVGKMGICRRKDTLSATEVSADGDNIACNATSKGEIYVKQTDAVTVTDGSGALTVDGTVAATQSGTWNVGTVTTVTGITNPVTVTDGAGALNVIVDSGTTAATQSGTWTMQPGNTANTTPWLATINQGGNSATVNGSGQLAVNCANCSGSGVSQQDNTGFTPGTTNFVPMGGEVDDTGTTAVTENNAGVARITAQRAVHMNLRNNSGTEIGTSGNPLVVGDGSGAMNVIVDSGTISINQTTTANDVDATVANFPTTASTSAISVRCVNTAGNAFETCGGTGGSGGTSSNFGSAFPTPGTAAGFTDGTNMVAGRVVTSTPSSGDAGLVVRPINPNLAADNSTLSTAKVPVIAGTVSTSAPTWTNGNQSALSLQTDGSVRAAITNTPTVTANAGTGSFTVAQTTAANLNVRPDTSGATGAAPPARANFAGGLQSGATGGFLGGFAVCDSFVNVNVSTATTTALITGVSGRHVRICGMSLVTAAANNVALISGTGATCGTGTTGMNGGTTAASGWNFAANGGLTQGNGLGTVNQTNATGDSVCIITSAATQLSGRIAYAIY